LPFWVVVLLDGSGSRWKFPPKEKCGQVAVGKIPIATIINYCNSKFFGPPIRADGPLNQSCCATVPYFLEVSHIIL
jgi:hypothetical protein